MYRIVAESPANCCVGRSADAGDGIAKPHQLQPVQLIGSTEVVDDFGEGFACIVDRSF